MTAIGTHNSPVHPLALGSFAAAAVAIVLAFYGSIAAEKRIADSPLNLARGETGAEIAANGRTVGLVAFVVPCVLGAAAALAAGWAMRTIERAAGKYRGDAVCIFAMLLGGFAAVIGGCMILAVYIWPRMPTLYTS